MIKETINTIKELFSYTKDKIVLQKIGVFTICISIAGVIVYNTLPLLTNYINNNKSDIAIEIQTNVITKQNIINLRLLNKLDSINIKLNELDNNIKDISIITQTQDNNLKVVIKDLILKLNLSTTKTIELYEILNNTSVSTTNPNQKSYSIKFKR